MGGISLITPPVGSDVCIINTLAHGVPVIETSETVVQLNFKHCSLLLPNLLPTDKEQFQFLLVRLFGC